MSQEVSDRHPVERIADVFLQKLRRGENPAVEEFAANHPEHADVIRRLFPTLAVLEHVAPTDESPSASNGATPALPMGCPAILGDYRVIGELGRGGMGVVLKAEQMTLGRTVALKILPFAATLDQRQLQRFRNEARIVAQLNHPHIVPVYDVGLDQGLHYYVMQYIQGRTLSQLIHQLRDARPNLAPTDAAHGPSASAGGPTSDTDALLRASTRASIGSLPYIRSVVRIGVQVARALQHAHRHGVIHRDVKPSNLILDGNGHIWITDFGLARTEGSPSLTVSGDLVGTLRYMSPEQVLRPRDCNDCRSDIYSLGATLYELLALQPAFDGDTHQKLLEQVTQAEPLLLRRRNSSVPAAVQAIVMKALNKNPQDRYGSAAEMAHDLERYLEGKPVQARLPTLPERTMRWCRRHAAFTISAITVWTTLALAMAVTVALVWNARTRAEFAESSTQDVRRELEQRYRSRYRADMRQALQHWQAGRTSQLRELLEAHHPHPQRIDSRGWEWYYLLGLCHQHKRQWVATQGSLSRDGRQLAAWDPIEHVITVTNTESGIEQVRLEGLTDAVLSMRWDRRGTRLAAAGLNTWVSIWDVESGRRLRKLGGHPRGISRLAWPPDDCRLATGGRDGSLRIWDTETGELLHHVPRVVSGEVEGLAWDPSGDRLAIAGRAVTSPVLVYDAASMQVLASLDEPRRHARAVAWSPNGRQLATALTHAVRLWSVASWKVEQSLDPVASEITCLTYDKTGRYLLTGHSNGNIQVWEADQLGKPRVVCGHRGKIVRLAWIENEKTLVSTADDQTVRVWNIEKRRGAAALEPKGEVESPPLNGTYVAWNDHGQFAVTTADASLQIWDGVSHELQCVVPRPKRGRPSLTWSPDGRLLAFGGWGQGLAIVRPPQTAPLLKLDLPDGHVQSLSWSARGVLAVLVNREQGLPLLCAWQINEQDDQSIEAKRLWSRPDGRNAVVISWDPSGTRLAQIGNQGLIIQQNVKAEPDRLPFGAATGSFWKLAWSRDGQFLAGGIGPVVQVWNLAAGRIEAQLEGHAVEVAGVTWSPDGSRLATVCHVDSTLHIWDTRSGEELLVLTEPGARFNDVSWSPDGRQIVATGNNGGVWVWDATAGYDYYHSDDYQLDRARLSYERAFRLLESQQFNAAEREFRRGQELDEQPHHARCFQRQYRLLRAWELADLAWTDTVRRDVSPAQAERALRLAEQAVLLAPEDPWCLHELGEAYYRVGRYSDAMQSLTDCHELYGGIYSGWNEFFLAMSYWQLGRAEEARSWYQRAVDWIERTQAQQLLELIQLRSEAAQLIEIGVIQ